MSQTAIFVGPLGLDGPKQTTLLIRFRLIKWLFGFSLDKVVSPFILKCLR